MINSYRPFSVTACFADTDAFVSIFFFFFLLHVPERRAGIFAPLDIESIGRWIRGHRLSCFQPTKGIVSSSVAICASATQKPYYARTNSIPFSRFSVISETTTAGSYFSWDSEVDSSFNSYPLSLFLSFNANKKNTRKTN